MDSGRGVSIYSQEPGKWADDYYAAVEAGEAVDLGAPVAVLAVAGKFACAVLLEFPDGTYLSPYYNDTDTEGVCQYRDARIGQVTCPWSGQRVGCDGYCDSDRFQSENDPETWLQTLQMEGIAQSDSWTVTHPSEI